MNAKIVKLGPGRPHEHIADPLNKTIHMAIKKEKARRAKERGPAEPTPFNGVHALGVFTPEGADPGFAGCVACRKVFGRPEGLATHNRMKHEELQPDEEIVNGLIEARQ